MDTLSAIYILHKDLERLVVAFSNYTNQWAGLLEHSSSRKFFIFG